MSTIEEDNEFFESIEARANMRSTYREAIPATGPALDECHFGHHDTFGEKHLKCDKCGTSLECGPFMHGCPRCQPIFFERCLKCHVKRVQCCC